MMSNEEFSSTEELYNEGSPDEPLYAYRQESQMRFYENVVYVQHVVMPAMLLEYIPVYLNYQTYEPYLINRFQVCYVPFIRHTYYTYLVPYYNRLQTPEFFPTTAEDEYNTPSNSYPEIISDQALLEDSDYEDCTNSSISSSDKTSAVSWTSLDSTSSYGHSELTSTQEPCDSSQVFLYTEHNDCFDGDYDEDYESNIELEYPQEFLSAVDAYRVNETDTSSLSLLFADNEKGSNELDSTGNYLHHLSLREDRYVEFDVSSMSVLDEAEKTKCLEDSEKVGVSSVKNIDRGRNILPESRETHMDFDNDIKSCVSSASSLKNIERGRNILPECRETHMDFDNDIKSCVSSASSLKNIERGRNILPESRETHMDFDNDIKSCVSSASSLKNIERGRNILPECRETHMDLDSDIESCVSSAPSLKDIGKGRNILPESRENHMEFDNYIESCVSSVSSLQNIEKGWNNLPESRENQMDFDNDIKSCVSSASSLKNIERGRNILPESRENHMDLDSDIESCVLSASSLKDIGKGRKILPESRENRMDFDNDIKSCVSSASSLKNIERGRNILSESRENHMDLDNDIESCVLSASSLKDIGKGRKILPESRENRMDFDNDVESCVSSASSLKNIERGRNILSESRENHMDFDNDIESCVSSAPSLKDIGKGRNILPESRENHIDFDNDIESCVSSASSLKNIEKRWNNLPESRENPMEFDNDIECCVSSASSLDYVERYQDENGLEDSELPSLKNEYVNRCDSHSSTRISERSQEIPLQKAEALHKIDAKVPLSFDDVSTVKQNDNDTVPAITRKDTLTSEENWKVNTEDYIRRKSSNQLYRSALQGDIRPKKSLPEVGTLATIFEDLPFPVNEPYDDGLQGVEDSRTDEFDLSPLEVERSNNSSTTLLPKKKRYRNTKKFFSGLFRCFRPR